MKRWISSKNYREKFVLKISIVRHSTRLIMLRLLSGKSIITIIFAYSPQQGLSADKKNTFLWLTAYASRSNNPMKSSYKSCWFQGSCWSAQLRFQSPSWWMWLWNTQSRRRHCAATDSAVKNSFFRERISQLITYNTGGCATQLDYIFSLQTVVQKLQKAVLKMHWKILQNACSL